MGCLADIIEEHIKKLINEAHRNMIEISRAEVASMFDCVPSQINYVLQTRFSQRDGYLIESRRGGGGYIRIVKVSNIPKGGRLLGWLHAEIGSKITEEAATRLMMVLEKEGIITEKQSSTAKAIIRSEVGRFDEADRDTVRASLLRTCLFLILSGSR